MREITSKVICDMLNDILDHDPDLIEKIINFRWRANEHTISDPYVVVSDDNTCGMLGIINGLLKKNGHTTISMGVNTDDNSIIEYFIVNGEDRKMG